MFADVLRSLGIYSVQSGVFADGWIDEPGGLEIASINPSDEQPLGRVRTATGEDYDRVVTVAMQAQQMCPQMSQ